MTDLAEKIRNSFSGKRIVIVGDLVADQFLHGTIARVSREAPVFILRHEETDTRAGAAANAAANVAALGGRPVLIGLVGDDEPGRLLAENLVLAGVDCSNVVTDANGKTTTKIRVLAGQHYAARQQVIRIDYERSLGIPADVSARLLANLTAAAANADAIVISDYNYGVASREIFEAALSRARERSIPLLTDSRFRLPDFSGASAATPNQEEAEQLIGGEMDEAKCEALRQQLGLEALLVTRGNKGMVLIQEGRKPLSLAAIGPTEPIDVTGAGDTVIAAFALGLASGLTFEGSAVIANHAGGIVVMKKGTATVSTAELLDSLEKNRPHSLESTA